ncbi:hypothetical protein C5E07_04495 [Pseudoclavibacter sp. RFBJ3]|uniref:hypothetical protein n=1 Tax=Pseudoclavibacter sp. VKM Ac-2888 TaxID=2783830 RepID=UPI000CE8316D|nr:hypothetical protein [Pseudoclavibacter sp. VKM Ac-2888]PPF84775.1 hypothetical protein C5C12_05200 [Pseudoclavibacter sp. RFBJ5]PPF93778.1 hypothetical protein C5E07_04495 [Pseudoclavibacter sp. RFBJ3]PPF98496.1 hypothetical protein C5C19_07480 [Pseudoclavibacter sp. RFBH5]PPG24545.1 hypothetical protein C5E13_07390 [Pseudoclavibacter sp. RFBI4]
MRARARAGLRWTRGERGSVLPLILVFLMIGLTAAYVLVAATSLSIERKRLLTIADAVALSASESFSAADVVFSDGELQPVLSQTRVEDRALATLEDLSAARADSITLDSATAPDGVTAHIVITGAWSPPLAHALLPTGLRITVSSDARVVLS